MKRTVKNTGALGILVGAILTATITGCTTSNLPNRIAPVTVGIGQYVKGTEEYAIYENEYFLCEVNGVKEYPCNAVTKKTAYKEKPKLDISKMLQNEPFAVVNFDFNKSNLKPEAVAILDKLDMSKLKGKRVLVRGYTDNIGGKLYNQKLAMQRAKSVDVKLRTMGLSDGELIPLAYGLCCYVESNDTADGREKNRRVEIYVDGN